MAPTLLFGISGGISAYKTPNLIRSFKKLGWNVHVICSPNALQFVTEATLETISENPVITNMFENWSDIPHLSQRSADMLLIAPCTATTLAKCATGIADNCLTASYLSFKGPVFIAPSMHTEMYEHPTTQRHLKQIQEDGVTIIEPDYGDLACGDVGIGRLAEDKTIIKNVLSESSLNLYDTHIVVTAGGTEENIDSVRCITNKSSGKLGHTIANTAAKFGATVTLISTKDLPVHPKINYLKVSSCKDMLHTIQQELKENSQLIMAAAVSDFTIEAQEKKIKRSKNITLELCPTPDILTELSKSKTNKQTFIGFCLEDHNLIDVGKEKKLKKKCDFMICNHSNNIGKDKRSFTVLSNNKPAQHYENINLTESAREILKLLKKID